MKKLMNNNGITIVALVITIIMLLILAGISIMLIFDSTGLFEKSLGTAKLYDEAKAREALETFLMGYAQTEKYTNAEYAQNGHLDNLILNNIHNSKILGDIVYIDNYGFLIDRSIPKIINSIGKFVLDEDIIITNSITVNTDYTKATLEIEVECESELLKITFDDEELELPEKQSEKYLFKKEVISNGKYVIVVKDINGKCNIKNIQVVNLTDDMDIHNVEELADFRDKVNSGRTFEGKVVRLLDDINLNGSEENKWIPIGTKEIIFKGTFDGGKHTIDNLYINIDDTNVGMFTRNSRYNKKS